MNASLIILKELLGICIEYVDYSIGSEGTWMGHYETGYWFYNDDQSAGTFVSEDGSVSGFWMYDVGTTATGTWEYQNETETVTGTWAVDDNNSTIKHDTTPIDEPTGPTASGECQHIGWEEGAVNSSGRREWCEDMCMLAGGKMSDVYETDRGTIKQSCSNYNDNDMPTSEFCTYIIAEFGMERCDTDCQPYGGVWDSVNGLCDWSDSAGALSKCPEELRRSETGSEVVCDVGCAQSGYREWSDEYQMYDCKWDNVAENTLVIGEPEPTYSGLDEACGWDESAQM